MDFKDIFAAPKLRRELKVAYDKLSQMGDELKLSRKLNARMMDEVAQLRHQVFILKRNKEQAEAREARRPFHPDFIEPTGSYHPRDSKASSSSNGSSTNGGDGDTAQN